MSTASPPDEAKRYVFEVVPRPIYKGNPDNEPENLSHAQIEAAPEVVTDSKFKKVKEALAKMANDKGKWTILPS